MANPPILPARRYRRRVLMIGGVVGLTLYVIGAPLFNGRIESDLERRVPEELDAAGFTGVAASFSGQDGTLSCQQPLTDPQRALTVAYDVWGVRAIELDRSCRVNRAPTVAPTTTAPDGDSSLGATGAAPLESTQGSDSAPVASNPTSEPSPEFATVADIVAGTPELSLLAALLHETGFDSVLGAASDQGITLFAPSDTAFDALPADVIAYLRADPALLRRILAHHAVEGRLHGDQLVAGPLATSDGGSVDVAVTGGVITVGGATVTGADLMAANGIVHVIDQVLVPPDVDLVPPRAVSPVSATLDVGSITFEGVVTSEVERAALLGAASQVLDTASVVDLLTVDPDVGIDADTTAALAQLVVAMPTDLLSGVAGFDGTTLFVRGTYLTDADRDAMTGVADAVGATVALEPRSDATPEDAVMLEDELNAYVAANPVQFQPSSATLSPAASQVIDAIARRAQQFGSVRITVEGHTDSDGNPNENLALSLRRAQAVRAALIARGLPEGLITAEGFGSRQPILAGGVEDKAASRRVEFRVATSP
jgi:OOP family OmpA-OmpF porin